MVITIDGPAGAGKSSVARQVARELHFDFLDTGAMYRAVGWAALRRQVHFDDPAALADLAAHSSIEFDFASDPPAILFDREAVGALIRSYDVTQASSIVAKVPGVREVLVRQQRRIGQSRPNLVTEGRDQGTVVFPNADLKYYLDASAAERARRRAAQIRAAGQEADEADLERQIRERDARDAGREVGPLAAAADAVLLDTTSLSEAETVRLILDRVRARRGMGS